MRRVIVAYVARMCGVVCLTVLSGCSGGGADNDNAAPAPLAACSAAGQKQFVLDVMEELYFWRSELPSVDPNDFASAEALLAALVFRPLDRFSTIVVEEEFRALLEAGEFVGLGLRFQPMSNDPLRIAQVFAGSPAAQAGLERGDSIVEIDGRTIAEINAAEGVGAVLGPRDVGVQVSLNIVDSSGVESNVMLTHAVVMIDPLPVDTVFDVAGTPTGYLLFTIFNEPSLEELDQAFASFSSQGVQNLVLDLRYNGGGAVSVAEVLGNLLGGIVANGEVFLRIVHNAENSFRDTTTLFTPATHSLDLRQIVIITTEATASASEIIINSLAPHTDVVDVVTVGATTFGKPVIQLVFPFCEQIFLPVTAQGLNADNEGDFFDGIPAGCPAADDLDFALGDPAEASLAEALFYLEQGACSVMSAAAKQPPASRRGVTSRSQDRHHPLQPPPDAYF